MKVEGTVADFAKIQEAVHEKLTSVVASSHLNIPDPIKGKTETTVTLVVPNMCERSTSRTHGTAPSAVLSARVAPSYARLYSAPTLKSRSIRFSTLVTLDVIGS